MKKQSYLLGLFAILFTLTTTAHFNELSLFNENDEAAKWLVMEKKFISDIANWQENIWGYVWTIFPATIIGFSAYQYAQVKDNNNNEDIKKVIMKPENFYPILGFTAATILALQIYKSQMKTKAARRVLQDFFAHYDENRFFVPQELQEGFDLIAQKITQKQRHALLPSQEFYDDNSDDIIVKAPTTEQIDMILNHAPEIIDTLQWIIMRHFEKRYDKVLQATAYNILTDTKSFSEIVRNSLQGTSFLTSSK